MRPTAVVMNMFYTGLGIARSLGEHGVPVIGLSARHRIYGNFTRYARIVFCPDSRDEPEALKNFLVELGEKTGSRSVLFPTRDDDLTFLDHYRAELMPYFSILAPDGPVLDTCLNKWKTYVAARAAGVASPRSWLIDGSVDLERALDEVAYPCVLKPLSSQYWRRGRNWDLVGGRKAIALHSKEELAAEYAVISRADRRALLQEMVPGSDDALLVAACYMSRDSKFVAGFNAQKVLQVPEGFGTGCIVQTAARPELFEPTIRLLQEIRFTGIAEVEYKRDPRTNTYQLIEINARPWDQHRLGKSCGADLIYLAYCEHAGLPTPATQKTIRHTKWIAEDTLGLALFRSLWKRDGQFWRLLRLARGSRTYAIWSAADPIPFLAYMATNFVPAVFVSGLRALQAALRRKPSTKVRRGSELLYERKSNPHS